MDDSVGTGQLIKNPALGPVLDTFNGAGGIAFFQVFLPKFIGILMIIGAVAFFFMLLIGSVSWILSGGDKAKIENAKARITSALVGLVLMIASFAIVKLIEAFFGINILSIDIGPLVIQ